MCVAASCSVMAPAILMCVHVSVCLSVSIEYLDVSTAGGRLVVNGALQPNLVAPLGTQLYFIYATTSSDLDHVLGLYNVTVSPSGTSTRVRVPMDVELKGNEWPTTGTWMPRRPGETYYYDCRAHKNNGGRIDTTICASDRINTSDARPVLEADLTTTTRGEFIAPEWSATYWDRPLASTCYLLDYLCMPAGVLYGFRVSWCAHGSRCQRQPAHRPPSDAVAEQRHAWMASPAGEIRRNCHQKVFAGG